jgi:hypothetical protein
MAKEKRLIDANEALRMMRNSKQDNPYSATLCGVAWEMAHDCAISCVEADACKVDAVEVVRCKDCKHLNVLNRKDLYAHCPKTNTVFLPFELDTRTHYCSLGERKDNE